MNTELVKNIVDEPELVRRAQKGDKQAFSLLVKQYESTVYGFAFKVCRNEEKAAETLQDTFVNVYRKLDQFNGKAKFRYLALSDRNEQLFDETKAEQTG